MIINAIAGLAVLVGGIIAAFFAGKRKERTDNDINTENTRIATESKIIGAIRDADNSHDWRGELHERE